MVSELTLLFKPVPSVYRKHCQEYLRWRSKYFEDEANSDAKDVDDYAVAEILTVQS